MYLSPRTIVWFKVTCLFERWGYVGACLEFMFKMEQILPPCYVIKFYKGVAG